ncbi:MAG: RNA polymerase sporulation sigma factor SigK [Lachnospiraceae bacterium]|nr:RNA polymerase sporulation sigma factor SigK [Lachnospiraceae bacterium]MBQ7780803.1 RNA polymerase sporulation sigma factor SigK [Lachnospiraceae bacterium]
MKTFQKPLSSEEEAVYIRMLQEGSREEAARAKEILIERNLRLVAHIVKKYQNVEEDVEDLLSIGTIGLIKAVDTFDADKGRLATYACRCIDNELLMMLRARKKISREVSLYEPIGTDKEGNEISLLDVIEGQQNEVVERMAMCDDLKKMFSLLQTCLTDREREILYLRYGILTGKEVTQSEIGKKMGISRSYVSRIEKKALLKLKEEFEKTDK